MTKSNFGPMPTSDSAFVARARRLQAWYRVQVLGIAECGPWQVGGNPVASSLLDGDQSGANFLSPAAFAYARERLADRAEQRNLTIDEHRLFNNMLSSMPMCFNAFADLRLALAQGWPGVHAVVGTLFALPSGVQVEQITVEDLPLKDEHPLEDKTAFDASIYWRDDQGQRHLLAIECKYTDKLGENTASKEEKKHCLAKELFTSAGQDHYGKQGFDQLARNVLLTYAMANKQNCESWRSVVLCLEDDPEVERKITALRGWLQPKYQNHLQRLSWQEWTSRGEQSGQGWFADHCRRFRGRYLDFSAVDG